MIAEFYLIAESFANNPNLKIEEIEDKTKNLSNDFIHIRQYSDTNKLLVHPDIYNVEFLEGVLISDLLYDPKAANDTIDRDTRIMLQKIIIESQVTNHTTDEVIEVLLPEHNENICHGLIGFNEVEGIEPELQIVYNLRGWLKFRRHFLGLYPKNGDFFIEECNKYFPEIYFHENNKNSVTTILHNSPKKIIYHLTALNDHFRESEQIGGHRTEVLRHFSIAQNLDEFASLEGDASRKPALTFQFINDKGANESVCCEPHLKLCYNDNHPGDSSYSNDRRIYFHEGKANIHFGKILVGHIGSHL